MIFLCVIGLSLSACLLPPKSDDFQWLISSGFLSLLGLHVEMACVLNSCKDLFHC